MHGTFWRNPASTSTRTNDTTSRRHLPRLTRDSRTPVTRHPRPRSACAYCPRRHFGHLIESGIPVGIDSPGDRIPLRLRRPRIRGRLVILHVDDRRRELAGPVEGHAPGPFCSAPQTPAPPAPESSFDHHVPVRGSAKARFAAWHVHTRMYGTFPGHRPLAISSTASGLNGNCFDHRRAASRRCSASLQRGGRSPVYAQSPRPILKLARTY